MSRFLEELKGISTGPFDGLAKASACMSGVATRLTVAHALRNSDPRRSEQELISAFKAWPIVCQVMAELEAGRPAEAEQGRREAELLLWIVDRRDGADR